MTEPENVQPGTSPSLTRRTIARGVRVFIFLGVAAAVVVIALTASRETLSGLGRIRWYWLLATVGLWFAAAFLDGARLAVLSRASEHPMSVLTSIEVIFVGYFMAAVTPFQVGGLPLQLYIMNHWGVSPGKASAVLLVRGVLFYGLLFAAAPFVAARLGVSNVLLKVLTGYIAVIIAGGIVLILASFAFPRRVIALRSRLAAKPKPGIIRRGVMWALCEFEGFTDGLSVFLHGRNLKHLLLATLLTAVCIISLFSMSATLLAGLGVHTNALRAIGLNLLLTSVLLFVPTPGASGIAEAGAAGLYSLICPRHMLGVYVVLWRLFSFYGGAITGGVAALRHLSKR